MKLIQSQISSIDLFNYHPHFIHHLGHHRHLSCPLHHHLSCLSPRRIAFQTCNFSFLLHLCVQQSHHFSPSFRGWLCRFFNLHFAAIWKRNRRNTWWDLWDVSFCQTRAKVHLFQMEQDLFCPTCPFQFAVWYKELRWTVFGWAFWQTSTNRSWTKVHGQKF